MLKKLLGAILPVLMVALLMTSCGEENEITTATTEDYIDMEITDREGGVFGAPYGKNRCFKITFPITFDFPDGSSQTFENRADLAAALKEWKAANPDAEERPHPSFPFNVIFRDSTTMEVTGTADLESIRETCHELLDGKPIRPRPHRTCFNIVYPIMIDFPDEDPAVEVNSAQEFRQLLRDWRQDNEGNLERPNIIYPIDVKMKRSGEIVTLNNADELKELHKSCRG